MWRRYSGVGKVCHNGKLVCGSLSAALTAGVLIAKFADTSMASARAKYCLLQDR